jgi:hypothetical protein
MRTIWIVVGLTLIAAASAGGWTAWRARERAVDRGSVKIKARSLGLALPPLPLTPPVRAQLQSRTGACWDSVYSVPKKNDVTRFSAKSD